MENSQSLAIDSFSYSWSIDKKPPLLDVANPIDDCDDNGVDHYLNKNFNFDIPVCNKSSDYLVHADDIFLDGYIKPKLLVDNPSHIKYLRSYEVVHGPFLSRSRTQTSTSAPATPFFPFSPPPNDKSTSQSKFLNKWKKSSTRILQKYSGFFRPICKVLSFPKKSNKVDDLRRKVYEVERWGAYLQTPPRSSAVAWAEMEKEIRKTSKSYSKQSSPLSSPDVRSYYDVDSDSIKEAILHCKRSFN